MGVWRGWAVLLLAAGCRHAPPPAAPRPARPTAERVAAELPLTKPVVPVLDAKELPTPPPRTPAGPAGEAFRRLTETDCLRLAAASTGAANLLDEENRVPPPPDSCDPAPDRLRRSLRYYAALELRNRAAADALERFFQLLDVEAQTDLLRQAFPVTDELLAKARRAKAAGVRFPLDVGDLERQRSQLVSQLEQAELGSRLLNLDLKRRLGLPYPPGSEHLWPSGDFAIDPTTADGERAVAAALADRPELRGLRTLHQELTLDTLPDARDLLRAGNPLLGQSRPPPARRLLRILDRKSGPDPAAAAELEVRRKQLHDLITERERGVADEARAAVLALNAQAARAALARERVLSLDEKLADAVKKRDANQPGAEFLEPQVRAEWLRARAELASEVAAWHRARVRVKAALGWLAWEAAPKSE